MGLGQLLWFQVSFVPRCCWHTSGSWEQGSEGPLRAFKCQAGRRRQSPGGTGPGLVGELVPEELEERKPFLRILGVTLLGEGLL